MTNYRAARVKLTNTKLNKLKSATKNNTGSTLRINKKNFQDVESSHELFLTKRQKTKIRNAFANNMSADIKLNKSQLPIIIQSGGFLTGFILSTYSSSHFLFRRLSFSKSKC